jgi:hypothetical protein
MQHFYDGQIRKYLVQIIRVFSNFTVKYADGTLHQIPVMYGDPDRQAATIMRQNSENVVQSVPRIAVHITDLSLDRSRLSDSSYVGKMHIREREIDNTDPANPVYTGAQGKNYTVERLMPTPFKLTVKVDIWAANTEQKLQILEQILVLFNPSLELQTTDNYIDWTSLSVLELITSVWSNRSVPVGTESPIDIATLTLESPIWISPPVKVKKLGVITNIITSIYQGIGPDSAGYIDGLGVDYSSNNPTMGSILSQQSTGVSGDFGILVLNGQAQILNPGENVTVNNTTTFTSVPFDWTGLLDQYPGKYIAGVGKIYLMQPTGYEIWGTFTINTLDQTLMTINWNMDTIPTNTLIASVVNGLTPRGTIDRIINPLEFNPGTPVAGTRYLLVEDIGGDGNSDGKGLDQPSIAWGNVVAKTSDIIEYDGTQWQVIFEAAQNSDTLIYQTNIYSGQPQVQYKWNGVSWVKSFEGEYRAGSWRLVL